MKDNIGENNKKCTDMAIITDKIASKLNVFIVVSERILTGKNNGEF